MKLAAVLVISLNGLTATVLQRSLFPLEGERPRRAVLLIGGALAGLSQLGWWTALVVGFLNSKA